MSDNNDNNVDDIIPCMRSPRAQSCGNAAIALSPFFNRISWPEGMSSNRNSFRGTGETVNDAARSRRTLEGCEGVGWGVVVGGWGQEYQAAAV